MNFQFFVRSMLLAMILSILPTGFVLAQKSSAHKIVVRVNGAPITDLDIKQRTNLIMMSAPDIQKQVRARAQRQFKAKDINERFRAYMIANKPKSRDEAKRLQKRFSQRIFERARSSVRGGLRKRALSELIDDRLKVQEARKRGVLIGKQETTDILNKMAKNNKMTRAQFDKFLRRQGIHPRSLMSQMQARVSWQRVAGSRLRRQVTVRSTDIDQAVAGDPAAERGKATEFDLGVISFRSEKAFDTAQYEQALAARSRFRGCNGLEKLAKGVKGARYQKLGKTRAGALPDNARPLLLATPVGKMAPPVYTPTGVSLYAVCNRKEVTNDDSLRQKAKQQLQNKQIGTLAKRLLKDLCQEAYIEPPVTRGSKARCGES